MNRRICKTSVRTMDERSNRSSDLGADGASYCASGTSPGAGLANPAAGRQADPLGAAAGQIRVAPGPRPVCVRPARPTVTKKAVPPP
jgi:hypothetical protein